jgi:hypothetical protein
MWRNSEKFIDVLLTAKFREAAKSAAGETPMPDLVPDEPTAHVQCPHDGATVCAGQAQMKPWSRVRPNRV